MLSVDTLLLSVPSAPVWSNSFEHPQRMEGRGVAEQARIVLFPGIPWVHCSEVFTQNVQRCSVSVQCSHWMGVCWREGKGHLPWGCCNLSALASTSPIKSISAVAEILAFLNGSRALHTVNEREVSLLCLPFIPGLVSGGEKNRMSHSGKLDLSQCLCTLLYSGAVELSQPLWSTYRGFVSSKYVFVFEINAGQSLDKKNHIAIEWVPAVGCRSQVSQFWHKNILECLAMSQGCHCQPPDRHLSEQNVVTEVWEQKHLPDVEVRRKIWS